MMVARRVRRTCPTFDPRQVLRQAQYPARTLHVADPDGNDVVLVISLKENVAIPAMNPSNDSRAEFRRLHESGCFVMPNPWDVGSARVLEQLGFPALATTSSGLGVVARAARQQRVEERDDRAPAIDGRGR